MSIFISHTTKDDELAKRVYRRLKDNHGIPCYIDDIDQELASQRGSKNLTPLLVERLRKCDTLLAVVTENTKGSWWVPFEIGTAREMPRAITSYTTLQDEKSIYYSESLPEYLLEWPRLKTNRDIDIFAIEYKNKSDLITESVGIRKSASLSESSVRKFESSVMQALGQRIF